MFTIANLSKNSYSCIILQCRSKSKVHWAKLRRKNNPKHKAMNHFDEFYGSIFGKQWDPMKEALLRRRKYVAVVNNFGDPDKTIDMLSKRGAHCLNTLMSVQQSFHNEHSPPEDIKENSGGKLDAFTARLQSDEISNLYPENNAPDRLDTPDITLKQADQSEDEFKNREERKEISQPNTTLDQAITKAELDESRIIDPSHGGITSEALYQFVPATKLKGMEDWVPESLHYSYYSKEADFPLIMEPETKFSFPEHLKVYTYEKDSEWDSFPEPRRTTTGVFNYYPMDCGSVLAPLALCLQPGERLLDLCAAPGGKSLVALQTLLPQPLVSNDVSHSRTNRSQRVFRDYLYDFETSNKWRERVVFTRVDGRMFTDDAGFDKVMVDVPCTTDRLAVTEDENNIFRPDRIKERLKIPELQSQLLASALKLVKVGGAVVYSTCSLSPIQNDGVVHMALRQAFETNGIVAAIRDLSAPWCSFSSTLVLGAGASKPKYGQLVLPSVGANFGPSYIARLVRVK